MPLANSLTLDRVEYKRVIGDRVRYSSRRQRGHLTSRTETRHFEEIQNLCKLAGGRDKFPLCQRVILDKTGNWPVFGRNDEESELSD